MSRLRRLRTDESGFSLTELMVSMLIGSIVLWAVMQVYIGGMNQALKVNDRVEATQRARLAIDRMSVLLDSQVCLDGFNPPILSGSDGSTATFYADLNGASNQPRKYALRYDPTAKTISELVYIGAGTLPGAITYPASPSATKVLATSVAPARDTAGTALPIFSYLTFESDGTIDPTKALAVPLSAANVARVVRVDMRFQALVERTGQESGRSTVVQGHSQVSSAEPTSPTAGANCA